jgi:hypothetical protein
VAGGAGRAISPYGNTPERRSSIGAENQPSALASGFLAVTAFPAGFHLDRLTEFLTGCCALLGLAWEGEVWDFMHIVAPHKFLSSVGKMAGFGRIACLLVRRFLVPTLLNLTARP